MPTDRPRLKLLAAVSLALTLGLSACGANADDADHDHDATDAASPGAHAREVAISATSFDFEPSQVAVKPGEEVAIALTSTDVLHDFVVEDGEFHLASEPGVTALGSLSIDEPGTYTVYCSVAGHRDAGMEATLVVE